MEITSILRKRNLSDICDVIGKQNKGAPGKHVGFQDFYCCIELGSLHIQSLMVSGGKNILKERRGPQ